MSEYERKFNESNVLAYIKKNEIKIGEIALLAKAFSVERHQMQSMLLSISGISSENVLAYLDENCQKKFSCGELSKLLNMSSSSLKTILIDLKENDLIETEAGRNCIRYQSTIKSLKVNAVKNIAPSRKPYMPTKAWTPPATMKDRLDPDHKTQISMSSHVKIISEFNQN